MSPAQKYPGFSCFIDRTVLTVTTGRDGKTVKMEPWSRPVPSRRQVHLPLTRTVPSRRENLSRCTLPSRSVEEISRYRPVSSTKFVPTVPSRLPSTKPTTTVPSRRQNLPKPPRPAVNTYPYRQIPWSKPVPTVPRRHSLPSLLPARCRDRQNAVNAMNSYYNSIKATTVLIVRIPSTSHFIYPSNDVRRRQFRPVTDGRLDVIVNNFPFVMLHESQCPLYILRSTQITTYNLIPIDDVPMTSYKIRWM